MVSVTYCWDLCFSKGSKLLKELKKLDDKALLVEVQLLESKVYHNLSNIPKSRFEKQIINFVSNDKN